MWLCSLEWSHYYEAAIAPISPFKGNTLCSNAWMTPSSLTFFLMECDHLRPSRLIYRHRLFQFVYFARILSVALVWTIVLALWCDSTLVVSFASFLSFVFPLSPFVRAATAIFSVSHLSNEATTSLFLNFPYTWEHPLSAVVLLCCRILTTHTLSLPHYSSIVPTD